MVSSPRRLSVPTSILNQLHVTSPPRSANLSTLPSATPLPRTSQPSPVEVQIQRAGDGKYYPKKGETVAVHYTLKVRHGARSHRGRVVQARGRAPLHH